jgi:hypothetical protein
MPPDDFLRVALNGLAMHVRPSELDSVAAGLVELDASAHGEPIRLAVALRQLAVNDRAPTWELLVRRYGRRKPLPQAAGEIGMDDIHARDLIQQFHQALAVVRPPE